METIQENNNRILDDMEDINFQIEKLKRMGLRFLANHGKENFEYMEKLAKTDIFENLNARITLKTYSFDEFEKN
jgi:biotin synthase-like enzyme